MGKKTKYYLIAGGLFALFIKLSLNSFYKSLSYQPLDKCFKASVSQKTLCNTSDDYVSYQEISPYLIEAVVLSEDDKFFTHKGVDWEELKNSFWLNLKHFSYKRGGSTITQQLVKNAYLSHQKSLLRKFRELLISYDIENKYSKKLILEKYLNAIEFGRNLWGLKSASQFYFDKAPSDLGILESLYLSILLPNPKEYSKSFQSGKLTRYQKSRIKILLNRLVRKKVIDEDYGKILVDDIDGFPWKIDYELVEQEALDKLLKESPALEVELNEETSQPQDLDL